MPDYALTLDFEGRFNPGPLSRVEIQERFGQHQIAILDFGIPREVRKKVVPELTPMIMRWGSYPVDTRTFYGYVNHHEMRDTEDETILRVYCIGSSEPMNQPSTTSWSNTSDSAIAKEIANRNGLRCVLHKSSRVLDFWSTNGGSDMKTMQRLAERTGYRFWVDGSTLFYLRPDVLLDKAPGVRTSVYSTNGADSDTLRGFRIISGSLAPVDGAAKVHEIYGLDRGTNRLIRASSTQALARRGLTVPPSRIINKTPADTLSMARDVVETNAIAGDWATAEATVAGTARDRLGDLVILDGSGLHHEYAGNWVVAGGTHVFDILNETTQFNSTLELIRNTQTSHEFLFRDTLSRTPIVVPATLKGRTTWVSETLGATYV